MPSVNLTTWCCQKKWLKNSGVPTAVATNQGKPIKAAGRTKNKTCFDFSKILRPVNHENINAGGTQIAKMTGPLVINPNPVQTPASTHHD